MTIPVGSNLEIMAEFQYDIDKKDSGYDLGGPIYLFGRASGSDRPTDGSDVTASLFGFRKPRGGRLLRRFAPRNDMHGHSMSLRAERSNLHRREHETGKTQSYFVGVAGFWRLRVTCSTGSEPRLPSAPIA